MMEFFHSLALVPVPFSVGPCGLNPFPLPMCPCLCALAAVILALFFCLVTLPLSSYPVPLTLCPNHNLCTLVPALLEFRPCVIAHVPFQLCPYLCVLSSVPLPLMLCVFPCASGPLLMCPCHCAFGSVLLP